MGGFILMAIAVLILMPMGNEFPKIGILCRLEELKC